MGSGKIRKKNDAPLIRRPIKSLSLSNAGIGGDINISDNAPDICIPSFDIKVTASYLTKVKVKVQLRKKEDLYYVMIGETEIGRVGEKKSVMISTCIKMGIRYAGEIILKNEKPYARFVRISR